MYLLAGQAGITNRQTPAVCLACAPGYGFTIMLYIV